MSEIIKIFIDPTQPNSAEMMEELEKQIKALQIGEIKTKKELPPKGTLPLPSPETIIIILKIAFWTIKIGKAIWDIATESRNKIAAQKSIPVKEVPEIYITRNDDSELTIKTSSKKDEIKKFTEVNAKDLEDKK